MTSEQTVLLQKIKEAVHQVDANVEVILFGSRARGEERPDSDWDVLILVDSPSLTLQQEKMFMDRLYDLELAYGEVISVFVYSKQEWHTKYSITPLYEHVSQEGMLL